MSRCKYIYAHIHVLTSTHVSTQMHIYVANSLYGHLSVYSVTIIPPIVLALDMVIIVEYKIDEQSSSAG